MPWPFGPDDVGGTSGEPGDGALNRRGRRLKWRGQRQKAKQAPASRPQPAAPVLFEAYEPRLLLSGAPVGTVLATSSTSAQFLDSDGTKVTATLTGPGQWQAVAGAALPTIFISGTDATSTFTITAAAGDTGSDARVQLEGVTIAGPMASFVANTTDPVSGFAIGGPVQSIVLGNVRDMVMSSTAAIGSVTVESWQAGGTVANGISAPSLGSLESVGQLNLSMTISGLGQALGSVLAGGALSGGLWQVAGDVGSIAARSVGAGWAADISGAVGVLQTGGTFSGTIAAQALDVVSIGGNFVGGQLMAGADLGGDGKLGGDGFDADSFGAGFIGQLRVAGAMIGAKVYVGVDPNDGGYDNGDDTMVGGASSRIQTLIVGGRIDSTSRIVTGVLPPSFFVAGKAYTPATAPRRMSTVPGDSERPDLSLALATDTGPSATDRITADASVTGFASDLGGIVSVSIGLDNMPVGKFTDLTDSLGLGGTFFLSDAEIVALAGGTLAEGPHVLHLLGVDKAGNARALDFAFTYSNTQITVGLATDTGVSGLDGVSTDYAVAGKVASGLAIAKASVGVDAPASTALTLGGDGSFSLSKAQIDGIAGGALKEGAHVLRLSVEDANGITTTREMAFTYDVTAPALTSFGLTQSSDTGTIGDGITAAGRVGLIGVSEAGAVATLGAGQALAAANGGFQFADVVLADGTNTLKVTVSDLAGNTSSMTIEVERSGTVTADAALTWNQATLEAIRKSSLYPETATRIMAMVGIAQFDTLAAIEGTAAFLVSRAFSGPVDTELALAKAAHAVLWASFPNQRADIDAVLAPMLAAVPDGAAKTAALALGQQIAQAVLDIRATDGSANYLEYAASDTPGRWRPTAPSFEVAEEPQWSQLTPFAMNSPDQFQAPPPPDLDSPEYAAALAEVQALGAATSATRTTDQSQQAQFWADGRGSYTPPGHWNQIAQQVAQAQGNSLAANVRLFAQLNVALADTAIASWNTKYTYSLWRPIDAIQQADLDGNDATAKDAAWQPLLITPPHPEYVSGHSSFSNAAAAVLKAAFGDVTFTTGSYTLPGTPRSFDTFQDAADEAGRSRIYGGIHFEFSNQAGATLGQSVAQAALARFNLAQDTQGPNIVAAIVPGVTGGNVTIAGQVLDNLSGVAAAFVSVDGAEAQPLTLDAEGRYSFTTAFAKDGTADGLHNIVFTAKDSAGNDAPSVTRSFRLDTRLPTVLMTGIAEGDTITYTSRATGWANPTGSTLKALTYSFDGAAPVNLFFDAATGYFDSTLDLSKLDIGTHTLTLRATDAAGNVATLARQVVLAALPPFYLSAVGPTDGQSNVGTTQRPEVRFSRAVKVESLTSDSFYAATSDGTKLAATIVPAQDGSSAQLFFTGPMPGGAQITLTVDGNTIRAAADGAFLDADVNGTAGGVRTLSFTTASLTPVAGTTVKGRVVDPGPDLQPMTFDDMRRGPDGIAFTPDDLFLNPIAHAKVYVLGLEDQFVFTDANGEFTLDNMPAGTVKIAIDGRTATNAPAGIFWPEMVMDVDLTPGVQNTIMDSMGTAEERASHAGRTEVYLPRVQATIFSLVSDSAPTTVGVDANSAPNLTDSQRDAMSLTVDPGSVIGADGKPLANAQIGISTVPPELVRDMLPPGVLQHTFDITIQAPGAATFATPATITFPNVFGAAPGTKLNILSFDHTTGMLVINGTATVSEDGKTVVSDEGAGVRAPGWHGITPPGGCNPAGGAPPDPVPPSKDEKVTEHAPEVLTFLTADAAADNFKGFTWNAPPQTKDVPPLPPIPGCEVPPHNPDTKQQPFISVTIEVDGALNDFAKPIGGSLDLRSQSFTLSAGTGISKTFNFDPKSYAEMFSKGQGFADLLKDQLYGARIKITEIKQNSDGSRTRDIYTYYENRFVAVVDAAAANAKSGDTMAFFRTNTDGIVRTNNVDLFLPSAVKTSFTGGGAPFTLAGSFSGNGTLVGEFDPSKAGYDQTASFSIQIADAKGALNGGTIKTLGSAVDPTTISVDEAGYRIELDRALKAVSLVTEAGKDGKLDTADDTKTYYYDYGGGVTLTTLAGKDGKLGTADDVTLNTVLNKNQLGAVGASFLTEFKNFLPDVKYTAKDFNAMLDTQTAAMKAAVEADYTPAGKQYQIVAANGAADVTMAWKDAFFPPTGDLVYGYADFDRSTKYQSFYLGKRSIDGKGSIGQSALEYAMAEGLNSQVKNSGVFGVAINFDWSSAATFAQFVANTVSHEIGHTFGLNEAYLNVKGKGSMNVDPPNDIMRAGNTNDGDLTFAGTNISILQAALGIQANGETPITAAVKEYRTNFNLPGSAKGIREAKSDQTTPSLDANVADLDVTNGTTVTFDAVAADGVGGASSLVDIVLTNVGFSTLNLDDVKLGSGGKGFTILNAGLNGATLAPFTTTVLTVSFDPATVGTASDTVTIASNSDTGPLTFTLSGTGIAPGPVAAVSAGNNNFGGHLVGAPVATLGGLFSVSNKGAAPLVITGIALVEGNAEFTLDGVPANLGITPVNLALGQSLSFGLSFSPSRLGLQRAIIEVTTNDPANPVLRLGAIGTGVADLQVASWGRDYVGMQVTTPNNPPALHAVSDDKGFFSFFLPNSSPYHMAVFDPATGLIAHDYSKTGASGKGVDLTATIVFGASVERDSDFDGLPDDIEFAIGSNAAGTDTDNDGLSDYTEIQQGLDALGGLGLPEGVVSAAQLKGTAEAVTVSGDVADPTRLTAYVATGTHGLAIVDVSDFASPTVLSELDLDGSSDRIAVDDARAVALLAAGTGGLHFVDISDRGAPSLIRTVTFADQVEGVALRDGSAFVIAGTKLIVVDVASGDVRQTLELGGTTLRDVVVAVDAIYTLDAAHTVRVFTVSDDVVVARGNVTLADGGSRMTVGNGIAYVAASTGGTGGYLTVNVADPDAPVAVSGVDDNSFAGNAMTLNGSGLGLLAGGINFVFGGFKGVDVVDVSDPQNTGTFVKRFNLPQLANDISIANGIAFVADGSAGLQVLNYRAFDIAGKAPTVDIAVSAIDVDAGKAGVQVLEGRSLHIVPTITDDVQVRNVELLVNGKVVANDPTFPFDLFADVPSIKNGGGTVTIQLRATDTGGNVSLSKLVSLDVVPDTFAPTVVSTSVAEGAKRFFLRNIDVLFDEAIDPATLNGAAVTVVRAGADGAFGTADDVSLAVKLDTRAANHVLSVTPAVTLLPGDYRFTLGAGSVSDIAGNALGTAVVRNFTVRPASDMKAAVGTAAEGAAPSANPGQSIGIAVPFETLGNARMLVPTINTNGTAGTTIVAPTRTDAATGTVYFTVPYEAVTGDVTVYADNNGTKTDFADGQFLLQIVPMVTGVQLDYVSGTTMSVTLRGYGLIEGNATEYRFGTEIVTDAAANSGPDVYAGPPDYRSNNAVSLQVPISDAAFGPVTVKTAGGSSTSFAISVSGIAGLAMSGTPANAALPSANPGQAVTLLGTGLGADTAVLFSWRESGNANLQYVRVTPTSVSADGTKATVLVPAFANGVSTVRVLGAAIQPLLQIVPTLASYTDNSGTFYVTGSGLVEGKTGFQIADATVQDDVVGGQVNVYYAINADNSGASMPAPPHGFGGITATTDGGTSAVLASNVMFPALGVLREVAISPTDGAIWVADNANPLVLRRLDPQTGTALDSFTLDSSATGSGSFVGGLQVTSAAFMLGTDNVPAGSLLLFNGNAAPDRVVAINPLVGAVVASLPLPVNHDTAGGVFDPVSGKLFLLDRSQATHRLLRVDPLTGAVEAGFDLPRNFSDGGLALAPAGGQPHQGNLWFVTNQENTAFELSRTGEVLRRVSTELQGMSGDGATGVAFATDGTMLVSSQNGRVVRIDPNFDPAQDIPTLVAIVAGAARGTAANALQASANAGQVIELAGSGFGGNTQVLFPTRDSFGVVSTVAVQPNIVSPDGTKLQVRVPDQATTGDIRVSNVAERNLGGNSYTDSLYRNVTVEFTAGADTAELRFADGGLEAVDNESWGLDNVRVRQGANTVFTDDFESGTADAAWSDARVDSSARTNLSRFSGRFASEEQRLSLTGLTAGQTYTLTFDLYALDSWDGSSVNAGPDLFQVRADGALLLNQSISNYSAAVAQTIGNSAPVRLQVVPTATALSGQPGTNAVVTLTGSGFQEGASTVTIGGVAQVDTNLTGDYPSVTDYYYANTQMQFVAPRTLDGPVRVTTEGGFDEIAAAPLFRQAGGSFTGIVATAGAGTAAQLGLPAANAGETITIQGSGFSYQTMVQFSATDDTGRTGTVSRQVLSVNNGGTEAQVLVPALARTGTVRVLGLAEGRTLQVVPTLRAIGGTVAPGNTLLIEATGLVGPELVVQVDNRAIGTFTLTTIADGSATNSTYRAEETTQQLLSVVLPSGVSNGRVTVSTAGGTATLRTGVAVTTTAQTPADDIGDTLATAAVLNLAAGQATAITARVGDGTFAGADVDLYRVQLQAGDRLGLRIDDATASFSRIRIFSEAGTEIAAYSNGATGTTGDWSFGPYSFVAPSAGAYYVGVTSGNWSYDPNVGGSGFASSVMDYTLSVARIAVGDTSLTAISATAERGTPAQSGVAAANIGQAITLLGTGLAATDRIVFTAIDSGGTYSDITVTPASVAADGTSLSVVVPDGAITGRVRLEREGAGLLLQVVPTLDSVDMSAGQAYSGGQITLWGHGFAEGNVTVLYGATRQPDAGANYGLDVSGSYDGTYRENTRLNGSVPSGAPTGPIRVVTAGGTSDTLAISFTGLAAAVTSGTPANAGLPAANPGQSIAVQGIGLAATTGILFTVVDESGNIGQRIVRPWAVDATGTSAQVVVPTDAITGSVRVVGDQTASAYPLQIVPVLTGIDVTSVQYQGKSMDLVLRGRGLVEGNNSQYKFGSTIVTDANASVGPNVTYDYYGSGLPNGIANMSVALTGNVFGPVTVTTAGGTSAPFSLGITGVSGTALSGTPANPSAASANPGQTVTIAGTGLSTATDVFLRFTAETGDARMVLLNPISVAADGTTATLAIPANANGIAELLFPGTATKAQVQIVPLVTSTSVSGGTIYIEGGGFVEGASTIAFAGVTVTDTEVNAGPNVYYGTMGENGRLDVAEPTHGIGTLSVTTAGGTSAPLALSQVMRPNGFIQDLAYDPATGEVWVVDNANPTHIRRINLDTGASDPASEIIESASVFGTTYHWGGLQVAPQDFKLGNITVPAGTLLSFNGQINPDGIYAVNPLTGEQVASLALPFNYDTPAGVFHPGTGHFFVLDRRTGPHKIVEIDPLDGKEVGSFTAPFNASYAGMAIDPVTGNIWFGSNESNTIVEMTATGTVVRATSLTAQGGEGGSVSGLTFDGAGRLLVGSTNGRIHVLRTDADFAVTRPTLTGIASGAQSGTPANGTDASANVGQVIELIGTNFAGNTRVIFPTRNSEGEAGIAFAAPTAISADGTRLQVQVPDLATTGNVRVENSAFRDLGFTGYADGIYRNIQLSFTATGATTTLRFSDSGIEDVSNESWGLDNVRLTQSGGGQVFADNFEDTPDLGWTDARVDGGASTVFTRFSGRFANEAQSITIGNLTAGQTYTLAFDLYAFDSWDGLDGSDLFQVSADGVMLMRESIANYAPSQRQTLNASAGQRLLVVPTLTGTNDRPGSQNQYSLVGSGFMEGATTITLGGVAFADTSASYDQYDVFGTRNGTYNVTTPMVLDGTIRVTTEGGSAEIAAPTLPAVPPALFTGIRTPGVEGGVAAGTGAAANAGQTIVLLGQGFSSSTLVQFQAMDDTGTGGLVTRNGQVNAAGTELSVRVPVLARTGTVTVLGAAGGQSLSVVPLLRSHGGTIAEGNTLLVDGTGLVPAELQVRIDGIVAAFQIRTVTDSGTYSLSAGTAAGAQQLLTVTVPAGISAGVITVTTAGGTAKLQQGSQSALTPVATTDDVGDTLATALPVTLGLNEQVSISAVSGDGDFGGKDVDLFGITLGVGDQLRVVLNTGSYAQIRVFDAAGAQKASQLIYDPNYDQSGSGVTFSAPTAGTYFVGLSGYTNQTYDPATAGSGTSGFTNGGYGLTLIRSDAGFTRLSGIDATATLGTPARAGIAAANPNQTITLLGTDLLATDRVVFTVMDATSPMTTLSVTPVAVAADGTSLTVVVPNAAVTGAVRLERDTAGILLQVVPVLLSASATANGGFTGSNIVLTGRGFTETTTIVRFGDTDVVDVSRVNGASISSATIANQFTSNARINVLVPAGADSGPLRVTTIGGTSNTLGLAFTGLTASATSGTPADAARASANPGQTITLAGTAFDTGMSIIFDTRDSNGTVRQVVVRPATVSEDGTSATVVVPFQATTGRVRLLGDTLAAETPLQIVPVLTDAQITYIPGSGASMNVQLTGRGFSEGPGASYLFGTTVIEDLTAGLGPDVFADYTPNYTENSRANLRITFTDGTFGPISVRTEGGTSAPFTVAATALAATATTGTPADSGQASANPGQTVTITGTGLSTTTEIVLRYRESSSGALREAPVAISAAAEDGTSIDFVVPLFLNGAARVLILGSSFQPLLQVVPVVTGYDVSGSSLYLRGSGFVESGSTVTFSGTALVDTSPDGNFDTYYQSAADNTGLRIYEPAHGLGPMTVTTEGGTSAPFDLNEMTLPYGQLRDVARDPVSGDVWVAETQNPSKLRRIDPTTGAELQTIDVTSVPFGQTYFWGGLQIAPADFSLNNTTVPAGSLVVFTGAASPDRVVAINPANGALVAQLNLAVNYDTIAGVMDPGTGDLYILDRRNNPHRIARIDADTGAEVGPGFAAPINASNGGMAINPATGNLWYGSDQSTNVYELALDGTLLNTVNLASQGVDQNEITGLSFQPDGTLLVASTQGRVFRVTV